MGSVGKEALYARATQHRNVGMCGILFIAKIEISGYSWECAFKYVPTIYDLWHTLKVREDNDVGEALRGSLDKIPLDWWPRPLPLCTTQRVNDLLINVRDVKYNDGKG